MLLRGRRSAGDAESGTEIVQLIAAKGTLFTPARPTVTGAPATPPPNHPARRPVRPANRGARRVL